MIHGHVFIFEQVLQDVINVMYLFDRLTCIQNCSSLSWFFRTVILYLTLVFNSDQLFFSFSFSFVSTRWWSEAVSAPRKTRTCTVYILQFRSCEFLVDTNMIYLVFSLVVGWKSSYLVNMLMWEYAISNNHSVDCTHVQLKSFVYDAKSLLGHYFFKTSVNWTDLRVETPHEYCYSTSLFFILSSTLCNLL